ncbi:protein-tyrosine phosphatase [Saonia flava]|uniref:protein-tyrosine-phosphatase n=1 Tax=Saonia flava TaxID=523696 RepID=A0A846QY33_9FLAO|nr:low molecular weight protein-tyrosine-phosphatase [Saonia flava]NJB70545.1 protein-tyrosine phosphatase [Saonia flava]
MKTKVLMVCLGNICRSPLAEGILKSKVNSENIFIDSAGTGGYHIGNRPDHRSIDVAHKHGIDITQQRCRKFTYLDLDSFDHIYVMDKSNYDNVISLAKNEHEIKKVKLLLDAGGMGAKEVPDPYYDALDGFEQVFHLIDSACNVLANKLNK